MTDKLKSYTVAWLDLVGLKMQGARRAEVMRHLALKGAQPASSAPGVYDVIESSSLVPGSESMTVLYAPGAEQYFAEVAFRFASASAAESCAKYAQLRTRMDTSYGPHQEDASRRQARWRVGQADVTLKLALPPRRSWSSTGSRRTQINWRGPSNRAAYRMPGQAAADDVQSCCAVARLCSALDERATPGYHFPP